ncbi:MAG: hypothetical protein AKCLJLPJ_00094 [Fimbriimonadales bacterium]|nr:hypothetical protein [Fimbriimonadales bacterium]
MIHPGDNVILVTSLIGQAQAGEVHVESNPPLTVSAPTDNWKGALGVGTKVTLIHKEPTTMFHAEAVVRNLTRYGLSTVAELEMGEWVEVDRRRSPRVPVSLSATATVVGESGGQVELLRFAGTIQDLSEVGCAVASDCKFERGTLVSIEMHLAEDESPIQVLGIVARCEEPNVAGIEFFDFSSNSKHRLANFIRRRMISAA